MRRKYTLSDVVALIRRVLSPVTDAWRDEVAPRRVAVAVEPVPDYAAMDWHTYAEPLTAACFGPPEDDDSEPTPAQQAEIERDLQRLRDGVPFEELYPEYDPLRDDERLLREANIERLNKGLDPVDPPDVDEDGDEVLEPTPLLTPAEVPVFEPAQPLTPDTDEPVPEEDSNVRRLMLERQPVPPPPTYYRKVGKGYKEVSVERAKRLPDGTQIYVRVPGTSGRTARYTPNSVVRHGWGGCGTEVRMIAGSL